MRPCLLLVLLLSILGCPSAPPIYPGGEPACSEQTQVEVLQVFDGDTIEVEYLDGPRDGLVESVRLIGIDTPEVDHNGVDHDCYALLAWQEAIDLLDGQLAWLTFDEECTDTYDRALAYVWRDEDGLWVNQHLVLQGFARACPFSPNTTFTEDLANAEMTAIAELRGRWAEPCNGGPECFAGGSNR